MPGKDIRNFFNSGKSKTERAQTSVGCKSALSEVREKADKSPGNRRNSPVKKYPRPAESKKRPTKMDNCFEISDSDCEEPLPSSVRKAQKNQGTKKKRVVLSDSDEEAPVRVEKVIPSSTQKRSTKRARISSDEDSPVKRTVKHSAKKKKSVTPPESEEEMITATDSEDEFKEVKKPKGKLKTLPGQTKLTFIKQTQPVENKKKSETLKKVDPNDFFGGGASTKPAVNKSDESNLQSKEKRKNFSPSQKENSCKKVVTDVPLDKDKKTSLPREKSVTPKKSTNSNKKSDTEKRESISPVVIKPKKVQKTPIKPISLAVTEPKHELPLLVPWVDKYKPRTLTQLVGQHGDKSPMNKLMAWLKDWAKNNLGEAGKSKKSRPPPWMAGQDGSFFKAALLSGSPGVGKTTCAVMACELLGFQYVEMNASDVRNKKHLEAQVAQLTGSHQIDEYFGKHREPVNEVRHVLIMDEVDGMSGNEDRAGISELMAIIKETKIPILCICNDRAHPKMRSLVNYCYDLRFPKPRVEQMRGRIMNIASQEKIKLSKEELDELIELSNHDVRQTIYNLQMKAVTPDHQIQKKDVTLGPFEAARKLLSRGSSLMEKQEMFFVDYGIMPLFVQENYLNLHNDNHKAPEKLARMRKAADLISIGDTFDRVIRSAGAWKLLNEQSMMSAALPCMEMDGFLRAQLAFPGWLGKNSTAGKRQRLAKQLAQHAHLKISADTHSLVTDYVPALREKLTTPLIENENGGISEVIAVMNEYDLIRDDADAIAELAVWPGRKDPAAVIQSKTKAALTRALNKEHRMLPYAIDDVAKSKKKSSDSYEIEMDEEGNVIEKGSESDGEEENGDDKEKKSTTSTNAKSNTGAARGRGGARGGAAKRGRGAKA